jgi:hypothetical protein
MSEKQSRKEPAKERQQVNQEDITKTPQHQTLEEMVTKLVNAHMEQLANQGFNMEMRPPANPAESLKSPEEDPEDLRDIIKSYITREGRTMQEVCEELAQRGRPTSSANLTNKLRRGTITYKEVLEIADILGYTIEWIRKDLR